MAMRIYSAMCVVIIIIDLITLRCVPADSFLLWSRDGKGVRPACFTPRVGMRHRWGAINASYWHCLKSIKGLMGRVKRAKRGRCPQGLV
jgi:hypothetical protein